MTLRAIAHIEGEPGSDWLERAMRRRLPIWVALLVGLLGVGATVGLGAIVRYPTGWRRLDAAAATLADVPRTINHLLHHHVDRPYAPAGYQPVAGGLRINRAQPFVDPGYILFTAFDEARRRPVVRLMRLSDGAILHQYVPDVATMNARSRFRSAIIDLRRDRDSQHNLLMHPLLMADGSILIHDTGPLARIDPCGGIRWMVDGIFHHSVERGGDGSIWAAYRYPIPVEPGVAPTFWDDAVAQVSPQGQPHRLERIADILDRNGLGHWWRGRPYSDDPFHLNDVQPITQSGRYWQAGDLLISLRNLSLIFLYRPSTGRILWHKTGTWALQHDVSVLDDHRITVFDNHWRVAAPEGEIDGRNRVPVYDFATDEVTYPYAAAIARFAIRTRAQGRATPLPNGDLMVEETERGRLLRAAPDGTLRWEYILADPKQRRLQLRWSRYLDPVTDGPAIRAATEATCT